MQIRCVPGIIIKTIQSRHDYVTIRSRNLYMQFPQLSQNRNNIFVSTRHGFKFNWVREFHSAKKFESKM